MAATLKLYLCDVFKITEKLRLWIFFWKRQCIKIEIPLQKLFHYIVCEMSYCRRTIFFWFWSGLNIQRLLFVKNHTYSDYFSSDVKVFKYGWIYHTLPIINMKHLNKLDIRISTISWFIYAYQNYVDHSS